MRPRVVVEYGDGVKITIIKANGVLGMQRALLSYRGVEANKAAPETSEALQIMRSITYPDLVSPVLLAEGTLTVYDGEDQEVIVDFSKQTIPFEQFILLPDDLLNAWESAVYQMNPHWSPERLVKEAQSKKEQKSSGN